jgi:hypothetical protein
VEEKTLNPKEMRKPDHKTKFEWFSNAWLRDLQ